MVEVVSLRVRVTEMTEVGRAVLRQCYGLDRLPLAPVGFELELKGVSAAVANALRRVLMDELPGHRLGVPRGGFDRTSDALMLEEFVTHRIEQLPLRPRIAPELVASLRLGLDVTNASPTARAVHAGDLRVEGPPRAGLPPLFNPTTELASLQPGRSLRISGIQIQVGQGTENASFSVARRGTIRPLDIPQHDEAEIREKKGAACDESGFKVSTLVADPRHFVVSAWLPAAPPEDAAAEVRAVLDRACAHIRERLRHLASVVDQKGAGRRGALYTPVRLESGLVEGNLHAPGETPTIGELLRRTAADIEPKLAYVNWVNVEGGIAFTLSHQDATQILATAIERAGEVFAKIQQGVQTAPAPAGEAKKRK
jgi:hypothetical protein